MVCAAWQGNQCDRNILLEFHGLIRNDGQHWLVIAFQANQRGSTTNQRTGDQKYMNSNLIDFELMNICENRNTSTCQMIFGRCAERNTENWPVYV